MTVNLREKLPFVPSFLVGLNSLPMLLGATLLPVADVFSSEEIEMSTSFSCPNESETTESGDLSVIHVDGVSKVEG